MKKTDLYRSIDSVKPDKELKANIIKAVEENDKVTVIKRPIFMPVMVGILVCINIGMAAKLVIFNKSQINMSEFGAKASISSASGAGESSEQEDFNAGGISRGTGDDDAEPKTFQSCVEKFKKDINNNNWVAVKKWNMPKSEEISKEPYYMTDDWSREPSEDTVRPEDNKYLYVRYVEKIVYRVGENDSDMLTNHEYIVGYNGECVPENIVSITESNVDVSEKEKGQNLRDLSSINTVSQSLEKISFEKTEEIDPYNAYKSRNYGVLGNIFMYPVNGSGSDSEEVLLCYYSLSNYDKNIDELSCYVYNTFFLNDKGKEITYKFNSAEDEENYWKETVYRPEEVQVPDIVGMDMSEAKKLIESAGLKIGTQDYGTLTRDMDFEFNQVMECTNCHAGESVEWGSKIDVLICPNVVPFIEGMPLTEAENMITEKGLSYQYSYFNYEERSMPYDDGLYVLTCYPHEGMPIEGSGEVMLIVASDKKGVAEELVGNVITTSEKMNIYYGNNAYEVIKDTSSPESGVFDFEKAYLDTQFSDMHAYGYYYGKEYFKIESIVSRSEIIYSAAGLRCGMLCENGVIEYIRDNYIYKELGADINTCVYNDYNYKIFYIDKNSEPVYIYIKAGPSEDGGEKIEEILVSCKEPD